jgi:hypothetical protein
MIARAPPSRHRRVREFEDEDAMTKADDILMFFCVSAFFAGLIIAVATLPV